MSAVVAGTRAKLSLERFQSMIEAGRARAPRRGSDFFAPQVPLEARLSLSARVDVQRRGGDERRGRGNARQALA